MSVVGDDPATESENGWLGEVQETVVRGREPTGRKRDQSEGGRDSRSVNERPPAGGGARAPFVGAVCVDFQEGREGSLLNRGFLKRGVRWVWEQQILRPVLAAWKEVMKTCPRMLLAFHSVVISGWLDGLCQAMYERDLQRGHRRSIEPLGKDPAQRSRSHVVLALAV